MAALLKDLVEAKTLGLSNYVVEGDSIVVISWVAKMGEVPRNLMETLGFLFEK